MASQPSDDSPCGTCSCTNDPNSSNGSSTTSDQGAPCNGSIPVPVGADPGPPLGGDNGPGGGGGAAPDPAQTPAPYEVAIYTGAPNDGQKCGNNPGSGYGYHDNLNYIRNGVPAQVNNVNEVVVGEGFPFSAGSQLMVADTLIGWMYQDQWGYYYFQPNPNLSWVPSVSISYASPGGFGVGFGFSAVPNTSPQQLQSNGLPLTGTPKLSTGKYFIQCWASLKLM